MIHNTIKVLSTISNITKVKKKKIELQLFQKCINSLHFHKTQQLECSTAYHNIWVRTWDVSRSPTNNLTKSSAKRRRAKSVDDGIAGGVHVAK